jgi:glutaredoxin 2
MNLTLYHYVHCPFCIRVRMAAGRLKISYKSVVLPYEDEKTPLQLTGKKMLPIMSFNGKAINESLDIIEALDQNNELNIAAIKNNPNYVRFDDLLNKLGKNVHNLAMPYWIYTPEFNEISRAYFQKKKEEKRGPFRDLVNNKDRFKEDLSRDLAVLDQELRPFYQSSVFTVYDILLASHLWGLYVVPEFQFEEKIHLYLQKVKEYCHFEYHQDFWK